MLEIQVRFSRLSLHRYIEEYRGYQTYKLKLVFIFKMILKKKK